MHRGVCCNRHKFEELPLQSLDLFFYTTLSYGKDQVMESCVKDAVNLLNLSEHEGNVIEGLYKLTTATENFK